MAAYQLCVTDQHSKTHLNDIRHHDRYRNFGDERDEQLNDEEMPQQPNGQIAARAPCEVDGE